MDAVSIGVFSRFEQLRYARDIVRLEGQTLLSLADRLGDEFCRATGVLFACRGSVIVTGMGKAGLVGQKIAATMASTGTSAHFLHPVEALHGDLGRIRRHDVVLILSYSGESEEITRLLPSVRNLYTPIVAITGRPNSLLAQQATVVVDLGPLREACALGLAPSTSTTAMLAIGDALALVISRMRGFGAEDFARSHPAGNLGLKLAKVDDVMRPLSECRLAPESESVRQVFIRNGSPGRRSGAIMLVNQQGELTGLFTDSDLARLLELKRDMSIDAPVSEVMTRAPQTVPTGSIIVDAVEVLAARRISELPVVDHLGRPIGLLDITDLIGLLPRDTTSSPSSLKSARNEFSETVPFKNPTADSPRR